MLALPALRGGLLALLAATLFGVNTPLLQRAGEGVGALTTAALRDAGAAAIGALSRRPPDREARLVRADLPRLLAMAASGAVIGPVALAWGLQRTSGTSASLMLTLEALFTAVLAWRLYHETMDRRVWTAMALLLAGGTVLVLDQGRSAYSFGVVAVAWLTPPGVDTDLSRTPNAPGPGGDGQGRSALRPRPCWASARSRCRRRRRRWARAIGATGYGLVCAGLLARALARREPVRRSLRALHRRSAGARWGSLGQRLEALGSGLRYRGAAALAESHAHEHSTKRWRTCASSRRWRSRARASRCRRACTATVITTSRNITSIRTPDAHHGYRH